MKPILLYRKLFLPYKRNNAIEIPTHETQPKRPPEKRTHIKSLIHVIAMEIVAAKMHLAVLQL